MSRSQNIVMLLGAVLSAVIVRTFDLNLNLGHQVFSDNEAITPAALIGALAALLIQRALSDA